MKYTFPVLPTTMWELTARLRNPRFVAGELTRGSKCDHPPRLVRYGVLVLLLTIPGYFAWGQEDPFSDSAKPAPAETAENGEETEESDEQSPVEKLLAEEQDPLVRAIVEPRPETTEDLFRDVRALLNLDRFELAKEFLKRWLSTEPDPAELAEVQEEFGTAFFLRLLNITELQPVGGKVAESVMQAAGQRLRDPARLAQLVNRLTDPNRRGSALAELVKAGSVAAIPLIEALGDEERQAEHDVVQSALAALGDEAVPPLIVSLRADNDRLRLDVIGILKKIGSKKAVPPLLALAFDPEPESEETAIAARDTLQALLGAIPSRNEAIRFLAERLDDSLSGSVPGRLDENEQVTVWTWDRTAKRPRRTTLSAADTSMRSAAQTARRLHRIAPESAEFEQLFLATGLEHAKRSHGYDSPATAAWGEIHHAASTADIDVLEAVLQLALEERLQGAAIAAVEFLGKSKSNRLLFGNQGHTSVLVKGLKSRMRRVQFAAARAVMKIDPTESYPGSSHLTDILAYLAASTGERCVLIGNPWTDQAERFAGFLNTLGFIVDRRQVGGELVLQASRNPDYEFLLISDAIDHPRYQELVQVLRHDPFAAGLPIGLTVRPRNMESAKWFAQRDSRLLALAPPQNKEDMARDVHRLLETAGRAYVGPDERIEQARFALDALARLAAEPDKYPFYRLLPLDEKIANALSSPELTAKAATVLGFFGTPRAQRALLEVANSRVRTLDEREAAAEAFAVAVSRRGLLLKQKEILRQYDIYNASESLDRETQQLLGSILDTIEVPSQTSDSQTSDSQTSDSDKD